MHLQCAQTWRPRRRPCGVLLPGAFLAAQAECLQRRAAAERRGGGDAAPLHRQGGQAGQARRPFGQVAHVYVRITARPAAMARHRQGAQRRAARALLSGLWGAPLRQSDASSWPPTSCESRSGWSNVEAQRDLLRRSTRPRSCSAVFTMHGQMP